MTGTRLRVCFGEIFIHEGNIHFNNNNNNNNNNNKNIIIIIIIIIINNNNNNYYPKTLGWPLGSLKATEEPFGLIPISAATVPDKLLGWLSLPCCSMHANVNHTLLKNVHSSEVPRPFSSLYPKGLK